MKIILASANKGKIKQLQHLLPQHEVIPYSDLLGAFDIEETGSSFKENAIIKAQAIMDKLESDDHSIIISDDSGITVPALNNEPNIYSARYAGEDATDQENMDKLISNLKKNGLETSEAFYTACLAIGYKGQIYTVHGWMYGDVIPKAIGDGGFGYDPMFIPKGYDDTLGVLPVEIKKDLSHRTKALNLAMVLINSLLK